MPDVARLENLAFECYAEVRKETGLLLHYMPHRQVIRDVAVVPVVSLPRR